MEGGSCPVGRRTPSTKTWPWRISRARGREKAFPEETKKERSMAKEENEEASRKERGGRKEEQGGTLLVTGAFLDDMTLGALGLEDLLSRFQVSSGGITEGRHGREARRKRETEEVAD